jgi:galactokinase
MRSKPPSFAALFGAVPSVVAAAPGRVNLLGEHTDYNLGFVLPTAIPQLTTVELRLHLGEDEAAPRQVRVASAAVDGGAVRTYALGGETPRHDWLDYVQGVSQALAAAGHTLPGCDLRIESAVPLGSGLSSSAALLVALFRAFARALSLRLSDLDIARLSQRVENDFVGAPVGILDPMACGLCQPGTALFLDTRDLHYEQLPLPSELELLVIHSGITHSHGRADGGASAVPVADYRVRRAECEQAARLLGVTTLRELAETPPTQARLADLPEPLARRVRHVQSENARVLRAAYLLRNETPEERDLQELAALFAGSQRSQQIDYEVSLPDIDTLVGLAAADPAVLPGGARLTGGGFGGSIVALARRGQGAAAGGRIVSAYEAATGRRATLLVPEVPPTDPGDQP